MDHLDNPLFESALLKSGCSPADIGATKDIARHAASEALDRLLAVTELADDRLVTAATIGALAVLAAQARANLGLMIKAVTTGEAAL